jgi:aconitate hydratase
MLPLTFDKASDYDKIDPEDRVSILGLSKLSEGVPLTLRVHKKDGKSLELKVNHTFNDNQIKWFKSGSALNHMAAQNK